jgi:vacuolar protein sorting-associated protein 13A/C
MFESVVSDLLVKYLGKYIRNLDSKNLSLGIWGGDVVLKDLEISPDALAGFNLPVALRHGKFIS